MIESGVLFESDDRLRRRKFFSSPSGLDGLAAAAMVGAMEEVDGLRIVRVSD